MAVITIKDKDGNFIDIPALQGPKGDRGDPGSDATATDVQINGTSIVQDGIANIPVAINQDTLGIARFHGSYGLVPNSEGLVVVMKANENQIDSRNAMFNPIMPSNLDYAVKAAVCDGKGAE